MLSLVSETSIRINSRWYYFRNINSTRLPLKITGLKDYVPLIYQRSSYKRILNFYDFKILDKKIINEVIFEYILENASELYVVLYKKKYYIAGKGFLATYPNEEYKYSDDCGWTSNKIKILYLVNCPKDFSSYSGNINLLTEYVSKDLFINPEYKDCKKVIDSIISKSVLDITINSDLNKIAEEFITVPNMLSIKDRRDKISTMLNNFMDNVILTTNFESTII